MYLTADQAPPEKLTPNINEALLVGLTYRGEFHYYVAPRLIWYLDLSKRFPGIKADPNDSDFRIHLSILVPDDNHTAEYIRRLKPYRRSCSRLRKEMHECADKYDLYDYYPQVLIDFDKKHFVSYYPEPYFLEDFVPDGWTSEYGGVGCDPQYFLMNDGPDGKPERNIGIGGFEQDYIPLDKRFWIDENGKSIFKKLYDDFTQKERTE